MLFFSMCVVCSLKEGDINKSYYKLLARILLYKFNNYRFQGVQKKGFKKRFMHPAIRKANMKEF